MPEPVAERILVVVPVFNHGETLRQVVTGTLARHDQLLVVDDGSQEPVTGLLAGLPVDLVRHEQNQGKGAAILTAADWALQRGFSHLITIDADGQHDPADLPRFVEAIEQSPQAVIVGHRDFSRARVPGSSRFGRSFSNFWLRLQTGQEIKDSQSGFRAYPLVLFDDLTFWTKRYNFEVEVLVRSAWAGLELRDLDISVHYPPPGERISHFRGFMDNYRLTLLNTHLTMRSIVPWPHRKIVQQKRETGKQETGKQETVSLLHPLRSLKQLLTENSSPAQLAAAGGVGVLLGALPLIACHTVAILFVSGFFRLNKVTAVSSSQLCMPPVVPALCIELGYYLRHGRWLTEFSLQTLGYQGLERLYEWLLGSLLLGPLLGLLVAGLIYLLAWSIRGKNVEAA